MTTQKLLLSHFRNIEELCLNPSPGVNLIYGDNGAGKTNVLEAMWLCTGLRSFRGAKTAQLIQFDQPFAQIRQEFFSSGRKQDLRIDCVRGETKKKFRLNGVDKLHGLSLSGVFCAVVFSPDHLDLITGAPEERRRFLDNAICQMKPHYADLCQKYQKSLIQRNHLIRKMEHTTVKPALLEVWDESLVGFGSAILEYRARYVDGLKGRAAQYYAGISGGRERLELIYRSVLPGTDNNYSLKEISQIYREKMQASLMEDQRAGFTTIGIHRDDLHIQLDDKPARFFASQGQKRSGVIALKLGESDLICKNIGQEPVIFLDDVMSELDGRRQNFILNHLTKKQVFITCCDRTSILPKGELSIFHMEKGRLSLEL